MNTRLPPNLVERLICPECQAHLQQYEAEFLCSSCGARYPVVDGIPIIIDQKASLFSIADYSTDRETTYRRSNRLHNLMAYVIPRNYLDLRSRAVLSSFLTLLHRDTAKPAVLVVGGRVLGEGMEPLVADPTTELVELDVSFGPRTSLIADAHGIPFEADTFDGVIIQAVLEHVLDPGRVVAEIHRVLKRQGLVYALTPFMQQVHGGAYDFNRYTALGHRRLFRSFEELESGAAVGPGSALAWSYEYFLISFAPSQIVRMFLRALARVTSFWLKWFDPILISTRGALDAASAYYFLGRRGERVLSDRELITLYRGNSTT